MILTSADISVHKTYTNPHDPINSLSSIYCGLSASEISLPDFELCSIDTPLENFTPETPCLFLDGLSKLSTRKEVVNLGVYLLGKFKRCFVFF